MDYEPKIYFEIEEVWRIVCESLIQDKSKLRHQKVFSNFTKWINEAKFVVDEKCLLPYIVRCSKNPQRDEYIIIIN